MQLATGLLYHRDLPIRDEPMRRLVEHCLQRVDGVAGLVYCRVEPVEPGPVILAATHLQPQLPTGLQ